jgi:hypothetical protein
MERVMKIVRLPDVTFNLDFFVSCTPEGETDTFNTRIALSNETDIFTDSTVEEVNQAIVHSAEVG